MYLGTLYKGSLFIIIIVAFCSLSRDNYVTAVEYATHVLQVCCQGNTLYLLSHNVCLGVDQSLHTHLLHHSLANNNNQQHQRKHQRQHQRQLVSQVKLNCFHCYIMTLSVCKMEGKKWSGLVRLRDNIRGNIRHRIGDKTTNNKRKLSIDVEIQHSELSHSNAVVSLMSVHIYVHM